MVKNYRLVEEIEKNYTMGLRKHGKRLCWNGLRKSTKIFF